MEGDGNQLLELVQGVDFEAVVRVQVEGVE